jgi:hypothetical protein
MNHAKGQIKAGTVDKLIEKLTEEQQGNKPIYTNLICSKTNQTITT